MTARLAIDDLPWIASVPSGALVVEALEDLCELLRLAKDRQKEVVAHDSLHESARMGTETFSELLSRDIPRDLRVETLQRLGKVQLFGDAELPCFEVTLSTAGPRHLAPTVAWAAGRTEAGWTVGCMSPSCSARTGTLAVGLCDSATPGPVDVFFVGACVGIAGLFRHAIVRERADHREFLELALDAYPDLAFADGALRGCRDLSQPFVNRREDVMRHLAVLNDHGAAIFEMRHHSAIEAQFRSHGIDISPENAETLRDSRCQVERERTYGGEVLVFEWHTKIEPHKDRIYVHPPVPASNGRVIVGIIHRHLRLPGD